MRRLHLFALGALIAAPWAMHLGHALGSRDADRLIALGEATPSASTPHPLPDLLGAVAVSVAPLDAVAALWSLHVVFGLASVALVYALAKRVTDDVGAMLAAALFGTSIPLLAQLGGTGPGTIITTLLLATCAYGTHPRLTLARTITMWLIAAALLASYPPMLLWSAALLLVHRSRAGGRQTSPLGLVLAPVLTPILATWMHPALRRSPLEGWGAYMSATFLESSPPRVYLGTPITGRLPWWSGVLDMVTTLPAALVLAALAGTWLLTRRPDATPWRPRARMLALTPWLLLVVPWITGDVFLGALDALVVPLPFLCILASVATRRALCATTTETARGLAAHAVVFCALLLPAPLMHLSASGFLGAVHSEVVGRPGSRATRGLPPSRDGALPTDALEAIARRTGVQKPSVYAADAASVLRAIEGTRDIPLTLATSPEAADALLFPIDNPGGLPIPERAGWVITGLGPGDPPGWVLYTRPPRPGSGRQNTNDDGRPASPSW